MCIRDRLDGSWACAPHNVMVETLTYLHLLAVAVLVGKVVFLSFVTAPVLARALDPDAFARVVRMLFPRY